MAKKLPYSSSKADPSRAQKSIREMLHKFGVSKVGFEEDLFNFTVIIYFTYNNLPVSIPVNYKDLADMYIEEEPWTYRRKCTRDEWETSKREIAYRASFSMINDFLKGLITMIELGAFSFEEIFMSYFTDSQGVRLGQHLAGRLAEFCAGQLALSSGKD